MYPKIGLALGAGGAKGFAHIGVIQVLLENKIPIHYLSGTSMGAVIAALYAVNADFDIVSKLAQELDYTHFTDLTIPKWGLVKGDKVHNLLKILTHNKNFEDLDLPLYIVATDLGKGKRVIFEEGNIANAIRASVSVPGVVNPFFYQNKILVDGAVVDSVPAQILHEKGADLVLAVDLQHEEQNKKTKIKNIYDVITQSIEILERPGRAHYKKYADLIIAPKLGKYTWTNFDCAEKIIDLGRMACLELIDEIKDIINVYQNKTKGDL